MQILGNLRYGQVRYGCTSSSLCLKNIFWFIVAHIPDTFVPITTLSQSTMLILVQVVWTPFLSVKTCFYVSQELEKEQGDPKWLDIIEKDLHRQFPFHEMFAARGGHG